MLAFEFCGVEEEELLRFFDGRSGLAGDLLGWEGLELAVAAVELGGEKDRGPEFAELGLLESLGGGFREARESLGS